MILPRLEFDVSGQSQEIVSPYGVSLWVRRNDMAYGSVSGRIVEDGRQARYVYSVVAEDGQILAAGLSNVGVESFFAARQIY